MAPHAFGVADGTIEGKVARQIGFEQFGQRLFRSDGEFGLVHALKVKPGFDHLIDEYIVFGRDWGVSADEAVARAVELEFRRLGFGLN